MLKKIGNIFKNNLPSINDISTTINNINFANYTRYRKNASIFRSFIEIDTIKATELGLSYFKTVTINRYQNSKFTDTKNGYTGLLDESQTINLKKFLSQEDLNRDFDLIKNEILGRDLNLSEIHNKFSVENFTSRKSYNYNSGLTVDFDLNISQYQDIFFELAFNTSSNNIIQPEFLNNLSAEYDLIIYAMNNNNEIIDVKKISNFNTRNITWNVDNYTLLYNIDDVDFDKLFNLSFDNIVFNNFRRKFYLNITQNCKTLKQELGLFPIDTISIQENSYPIELDNNTINVSQAFENTDKITLECNKNLENIEIPFVVNYKLFMKIAGRNSYVIKNFTNQITSANFVISQRLKLEEYLRSSKVSFLASSNAIKIELNLQKSAMSDNSFNPYFSNIFINDFRSKDYIQECFTFLPKANETEDLNLQGSLLKNTSSATNELENSVIFYIRNYAINPLNLKFVFEQDFEVYEISFPINVVYEIVNYEQKLTIQNFSSLSPQNFSNLDIEYSIKIKNFKNSNTNLNRFLSLNYENIFLQELQDGITQLSRDFENNIFVVVKKSIYQFRNHVKDKYYIFNKDINLGNLQQQTENDLNLILNFKDDLQLNQFFFKEYQFDNIDLNSDTVKYTFEARIMIIPLGFFITQNNYSIKSRIKELLSLNNVRNPIPSDSKIEEMFQILKKINENNFRDLNQTFLYKLFNEFCLKDTHAENEIILSNKVDQNLKINRLKFRNFSSPVISQGTNQIKFLNFTIYFDVVLKNSDNTALMLLLNNLTNLFNPFYFKTNDIYTKVIQLIPEFNETSLQREIQNNLRYTFRNNSNSIELQINLMITAELKKFFNVAYNISTVDFSPYTFNFLKNNIYLKLNLSNLKNEGQEVIDAIEFLNIDNQYLLLDFYPIIESI